MTLTIAIVFGVFSAVAALSVLIGLPGIWAMALASLIVEWTAPELMSWWAIGGLLAIAVIGEVIETVAGSVGAKARGASNRAMIAAAFGGIVGGIAGTLLIPVPVVGTIVGSALGAGIAAVALELTLIDRRDLKHLSGVGIATAIGRLLAVVIKSVLAVVAFTVVLVSLMF